MPYSINGKQVNLSAEPFEENGRHYVPLAEVVQQLGGTTNAGSGGSSATATIGQWTANVQANNTTVNVTGQDGTNTNVSLVAPPIDENGTLYVPWDFFREAYGYKANMEGDTLYIHL